MELSKQGHTPVSASIGSQPLPSPSIESAQVVYPSMLYPTLPVNWGAQPLLLAGASVPVNSYFIVPMSEQSTQVGASRPNTSNISGVQPLGRVSLRPPQQVLNIQTSSPAMVGSQPPPYTASKKLQQAAPSPKVQMLNSGPLLSSSKRSAQKDPPKVQPQLFESVRLKLRKSLAAALNMGSEQQDEQCTTEKEPSAGAEGERKEVEGDSLQDTVTATSHDASTPNLEAVSIVAAKKSDEYEKLGSDLRANMMKSMNDDVQQHINHVSLGDEIPSSCMAVADELLHGHGLCWASDFDAAVSVPVRQPNLRRPRNYNIDGGFTESILEPEPKRAKTADESMENKRSRVQKAENLASKIEEQLFKLFGGVNKKYKEKGRSLLFNLKDKNNPELRERVLSGDILPERLCSMTAEELASKELSQWRLAKAEEMAQMVVLPDTEVDVRRLVRKTHKGEIQVEVEETDGISVEVELGGNLLSHVPSKADEKTGNADKISVERGDKASDGIVPDGDTGTGNNNLSGNLEYLVNEKTDLMQELMVDDLKDSRNLPPIMSLDEFMEALDSEPPFENLSVEIPQEDPSSTDKADTTTELKLPETEDKVPTSELESGCDVLSSQDNSGSKLESPKYGAGSNMSPVEPPERDIVIKSSPDKVDAKKEDTENDLNSESTVQCKTATPDVPLVRDSIWEGEIRLTLSSLTNVVAIFKSGEKPSTKEWPSSVGIKGRVKLSAFQEFLEQLPKSRSRAIMVTELCWKEGSLESGRQHLLQTIDSYIADERVGLAAPVDGVELYLCPSQGKTVEMLCQHLLKEHTESLTVTGSSVIGVVVWRRPYVSSRTPSHHRHDGSKSQSNSSKQYVVSSNLVPTSSLPLNSSGRLPGFSNQRHEEDVTDDVPPGFGPGVARDDDDLPEFHFVNASKTAANVTPQAHKGRPHVLTSARPVEQMRELVHKYGKRSVEVQPWNDDDDDIPEWNPNQSNHNETRQLPLPVPPPPVQQMHTYHQQPHPPQQQQYHSMQPLQINHQPTMVNNHLPQAHLQPQQYVQPVQQLPLIHQQQHHLAQSAQLGWQPNAWRPASGAPAGAAAPAPNMVLQSHFGVMLNNGGQAYGVGNLGSVARRQQ